MIKRLLLMVVMSMALPAAIEAQLRNPAAYDRYLLPVHTITNGAGGRWIVQWWVRNDGDTPADVFPFALGCGLPPPPVPGGPLAFILGYPAVPPATTATCLVGDVLPSFPATGFVPVRGSVGVFLYLEKSRPQLSVSGSLAWQPDRLPMGEAAPLRAVPERAFRIGRGSVFPVPVIAGERYALRIYALPETLGSGDVTVRIYEMQPQFVTRREERLIATFQSAFRLPDASLFPCTGCDVPPVQLAPAILELFDLPVPPAGSVLQSPMRVEITPASPNVRWWAVLSATENLTHRVKLFQPAD